MLLFGERRITQIILKLCIWTGEALTRREGIIIRRFRVEYDPVLLR